MKNNTKRVALYDPYLDTLGGGEKHILSILEVLAEQGFEINIFWNINLSEEIKERFGFRYIDKVKFLPDIFKTKSSSLKTSRTLQTFDYFFYVTDGSYFLSGAKKNFVFCMVPDKKLYNLNLLNRAKLWNYKFISNSPFTTKWLQKWDIKPTTITPYINDQLFVDNKIKKEKIILSVGRFYPQLHSKNHEMIINAFKKLKMVKEFSSYRLVLAGGLKNEDKSYLIKLKELAKDDPTIIFKTNISHDELYKLYKLSNYFWHFTGYGVDENINPEKVEHLGITPLEAMASGCLTFCYKAGGPEMLIKNNENGFLFSNIDGLINQMIKTISNRTLTEKIINNQKKFVKENFSYQVFSIKVKDSLK
jgi:glycosyltransferase involved in cell wall biosynthesis